MDGNALWQLLQSEQGRNALEALLSGAQGASNAVASTVTAPVDSLAWLLQQAGIDVGSTPIGGDAWARRVGLIRDPSNPLAASIGEGLVYAAGGIRPSKIPGPLKK
jgi:hypothetical protein